MPSSESSLETRPLGVISDFVVQELPQTLSRIRGGLPAYHLAHTADLLTRKLLTKTAQEALNHPHQAELASLDLKMLESGIVHSGATPPAGLETLVNAFSATADQPPALTYEEIVIINPPQDPRLFTQGEIGNSENAFYNGHRKIEGHLDKVIEGAKAGIDLLAANPTTQSTNVVGKNLQTLTDELENIISGMHTIGLGMPREHFSVFRQYLTTHPLRDLKGPSGAFTAGIPTLELLLGGENLPDEYVHYLLENKQYFPRKGREQIEQALTDYTGKDRTLASFAQELENSYCLKVGVIRLSEMLRRFRGVHYKSVRHQIPEAVNGQTTGTAGEADPGKFLRNRLQIRHIQ